MVYTGECSIHIVFSIHIEKNVYTVIVGWSVSLQPEAFSICHREGLLVVNYISFCLSGNVFISLSFLKNSFVGYRIHGWHFFSFSPLKGHCLLASMASNDKSAVNQAFLVHGVLLLSCYFQDSLSFNNLMYICMDLFGFILLVVHWVSWGCNVFPCTHSPCVHIGMLDDVHRSVSLHYSLFSLDWIISIDLPSGLLILSFVCTYLLSPFSKFFISVIVLSTPEFLFDSLFIISISLLIFFIWWGIHSHGFL